MDEVNRLYSKEDCVRKACEKIYTAFSEGLDIIYSDIWRAVQIKNPETQASFVVNQEKAQVSNLVNRQTGEMRNIFIEELCHASKAEQADEQAYSHSQAVLMWQSVAIRIELPVLEYTRIEPVSDSHMKISEEELIVDVLKRHSLEILQELKQSGVQEKKCEDVRKKLNVMIDNRKKKADIGAYLSEKIKKEKSVQSVYPSVEWGILEERKEAIRSKLESWVKSIGEMVLKEEPIL